MHFYELATFIYLFFKPLIGYPYEIQGNLNASLFPHLTYTNLYETFLLFNHLITV